MRSLSEQSRRAFFRRLALAAPMFALPKSALADGFSTRALRFAHTHTGEQLSVEYFSSGQYWPDALSAIDWLLRDFRTGDVHVIDPELLDLLHRLATMTDTERPFQVISGYRSPATNEMLRHRSEGVAAGSLHMQGQAIDVRLADIPLVKLKAAALAAHRGGVGYYPASEFVHVDTGRVRVW
jgi:uncharacterized protein YcbK (DUF882 family)